MGGSQGIAPQVMPGFMAQRCRHLLVETPQILIHDGPGPDHVMRGVIFELIYRYNRNRGKMSRVKIGPYTASTRAN